jgi:hypothetical protein
MLEAFVATTSAADIISMIAAAESASQSFVDGRNPPFAAARSPCHCRTGLSRFLVHSHPVLLAESLQPLIPPAVNPAAI